MNNRCVPDWNLDDETRSLLLPHANQKKSLVADDELIELFWRDGHVVMHSQTHRKPLTTITESKQSQKPEPLLKCGVSFGSSSELIQEEETASWFQYPLDDSLEKEFCSEFFCEMPAADATGGSNTLTGSTSKPPNPCLHENTMSPPKSHSSGNDSFVNFPHFSRTIKADMGFLSGHLGQKGTENGIQIGVGESSGCGSNHVPNLVNESHTFSNDATGTFTRSVKEDVQGRSPREGATLASSSGCSFGRREQQNASNQSHKRKGRDGDEYECHSEEAEYESVEANKSTQRSSSSRRTRAAEVHNLSERRRRDRINEKMRVLQELIPHCNKSDKASMLDEAIEYLKSLQLQVQIMWMGGGMAPMIFPGVQQYMPRMGMGLAQAPMPSIHNPIILPRVPLVSQSIPSAATANHQPVCPNPVNFPTQMQNVHLPEAYARYLGFHHMQPSPQAMNLYAYGYGAEQNLPSPAAASSRSLPTSGLVPEKIQNGHCG